MHIGISLSPGGIPRCIVTNLSKNCDRLFISVDIPARCIYKEGIPARCSYKKDIPAAASLAALSLTAIQTSCTVAMSLGMAVGNTAFTPFSLLLKKTVKCFEFRYFQFYRSNFEYKNDLNLKDVPVSCLAQHKVRLHSNRIMRKKIYLMQSLTAAPSREFSLNRRSGILSEKKTLASARLSSASREISPMYRPLIIFSYLCILIKCKYNGITTFVGTKQFWPR